MNLRLIIILNLIKMLLMLLFSYRKLKEYLSFFRLYEDFIIDKNRIEIINAYNEKENQTY